MLRVLIQAGHVAPREPGHIDETGTTREQEFTLAMQRELSALMRADGRFRVQTCGGDIPDGWTGDIFLALHGDGGPSGSHGYSFGWPGNGRNSGDGPRLARAIAARWADIGHPGGHHADNYTDGMRGYYGWSRVAAARKVIIEHGFLSTPTERAWMFTHIPTMAKATYLGILDDVGLNAPVRLAKGPLTLRDRAGQVITRGYLTHPLFVAQTAKALKGAGKRPPWVATVDGRTIATGRFWPLGQFQRTVARAARTGHTVRINNTVTITKE